MQVPNHSCNHRKCNNSMRLQGFASLDPDPELADFAMECPSSDSRCSPLASVVRENGMLFSESS